MTLMYHWTGYTGNLYIFRVANETNGVMHLKLIWPENLPWNKSRVDKRRLDIEEPDGELWTSDVKKIPPLVRAYRERKTKEHQLVINKISNIMVRLT